MGSMKVTSLNGVKVYSVSDQRSFPSWLPPSKLKTLKKNDDYTRRIELIQDMSFETAATRIKSTPDNEFIIVSGIYPPQVKVYEVRELSMKFERHLDAEIVDFQVLGNDYSKLAFLCADRSVWLHAKYGSHYQLRIPRMGRDLAYDCWSADLLLAASSPELYRINLEQGRFLAPISTRSPAVNVLARSPVHGLLACGGEDGAVECFDLRQKAAVGRISIGGTMESGDQPVTALRFDDSEGFQLAVGTSLGQILLYDLRSSTPIHVKDHMYGTSIVDIKWHESLSSTRKHIITADSHVVRIWDPNTGDAFTNLEPPAGSINDICVVRNSGLMFMALDSPQIPAYFIPTLGPAPRWCSYLENLTEEMEEEGQNIIYDDFKFVTKEDLEKLNLSNLIGTNLLHAYMHGFFIDHRLFNKAKSLADPFAYETYRQKRIQEKLDAERATRITIKRKLPKVNKELAARLLEDAGNDAESESDEESGVKRKKSKKSSLLEDERFKAMFTDKAFEVDEESQEYKLLHPNFRKSKSSLLAEHFDEVEESDNDQADAQQERDSQSDSDDLSADGSSDDEGLKDRRESKTKQQKKKTVEKPAHRASKPRFYEVKDDLHADAFRNKVSLMAEKKLPLEERISMADRRGMRNHRNWKINSKGQGGGREISFKMGSAAKSHSAKAAHKKRGIQSLGLRNGNSKGYHDYRSPKNANRLFPNAIYAYLVIEDNDYVLIVLTFGGLDTTLHWARPTSYTLFLSNYTRIGDKEKPFVKETKDSAHIEELYNMKEYTEEHKDQRQRRLRYEGHHQH
ncbi:hypothetical protein GOP47_0014620 [Adiantum capillus-veneris]|uniref:Nucleolar protein 10 n=1 Tax=Adiantum capillus-veneris TaxID=13818 RepID=A0A9D4UM50_ADICA|nr:hypothetical protein GOP47_0014620 [Adiantum capillus-veneris]